MYAYITLFTFALSLFMATRPARLRAAERRHVISEALLAEGLCPGCAGAPFNNVLMNGLSGCLDCDSTGTAARYRLITNK